MADSGGSVGFTNWDEVCETQDEPDGTMSFFPHRFENGLCVVCDASQSGRQPCPPPHVDEGHQWVGETWQECSLCGAKRSDAMRRRSHSGRADG